MKKQVKHYALGFAQAGPTSELVYPTYERAREAAMEAAEAGIGLAVYAVFDPYETQEVPW